MWERAFALLPWTYSFINLFGYCIWTHDSYFNQWALMHLPHYLCLCSNCPRYGYALKLASVWYQCMRTCVCVCLYISTILWALPHFCVKNKSQAYFSQFLNESFLKGALVSFSEMRLLWYATSPRHLQQTELEKYTDVPLYLCA